jgi:uncharacterized protein with HEPN domain
MSPRNIDERIEDIIEAIQNIQSFTCGMSFEDFQHDLKTIRACAFEISLMGEAARALPEGIRQRFAQVPWEKMVAVRNIVVHEYFRVDLEILGRTITENIPEILPALETALRELENRSQK